MHARARACVCVCVCVCVTIDVAGTGNRVGRVLLLDCDCAPEQNYNQREPQVAAEQGVVATTF